MSEPEKLKRRFWQFHLLTLVLMTLAAGVALSVNSVRRYTFVSNGDMCEFGTESCGWPVTAFEQDVFVVRPEFVRKSPEEFKTAMNTANQSHPNEPQAHYIENVGIAVPLGGSKDEFIGGLGTTVSIPQATSNRWAGRWRIGSVIADLFLGMFAVIIVGSLCESILRRREARKT